MKHKVEHSSNRHQMDLAGTKKHYFYYTIPSDSEESDFDEDDLDEHDGECAPNDPELAAVPAIWFFSKNDLFSSISSQRKDESVSNSDSEDQNFKNFSRLQSRECVPKSDDAIYGETPPKVPSRIRFNDTPEIFEYEQVTEFEASVYDYRYEEFLRMRNKCENGGTTENCNEIDDEFSDEELMENISDKDIEMSLGKYDKCVLEDEDIWPEKEAGFSGSEDDSHVNRDLSSPDDEHSSEEKFPCDDVGDRLTEETSGVSCDDLEEELTGEKSSISTDEFEEDCLSDDLHESNGMTCTISEWRDWNRPFNNSKPLKIVS